MTFIRSDELLAMAKRRYFLSDNVRYVSGGSGVNNTTRVLEAGDARYILRVYETHRDADKVRFEHEVLNRLRRMKVSLPYTTPQPIASRSGDTLVRTDEGKLAALFGYIEGERPRLEDERQIVSFGRAAASLGGALALLAPSVAASYPPYYELEHTHPSCPPETIVSFCFEPPPPFAAYGAMLRDIGQWCDAFWKLAPSLRQLPRQLIHGDLNASNLLADDQGHICALLDFEFVTNDLPLMEAAVCMSDLIVLRGGECVDEPLSLERLSWFLRGWSESAALTAEERSLLPLLIQLRRVDVFVHFLGRYLDKVNDETIVQSQIVQASRVVDWLRKQRL